MTKKKSIQSGVKSVSETSRKKKGRPDRDRRVRQADRLARVLRVLELIQSRGNWTTKAIADEIECSERTVYRDLDVLKFAGIPYYRQGNQQVVRVRPDFKFPVMTLTEEEVLGLSLATVISKTPGLDVSAGAGPTTRKVSAVSRAETQDLITDAMQLVTVLDLKLADHSRHHKAIQSVQLALVHRKQVSGQYESPYDSQSVKLTLHPYHLCLIKNAWYVVGRPASGMTPRTYRVARFKTLRMLEETAIIPEDFNLREYFGNAWAVYRGDQTYDVELWFNPDAGRIVCETIWHQSQKSMSHSDGSVTLQFRVDGLEEISNWILSWTGKCKIIQPPELRDQVVSMLQEGISLNAKLSPAITAKHTD